MKIPLPTPLRHGARDLLAQLLWATGPLNPARRGFGHLTVVTFHRVLPREHLREYPLAGLCVTPDELAWYLDFFSRHFECMPLAEAAELFPMLTADERPLLSVTFDDGQLDNHTFARPVLARAGVRGTFFVPAKNIETGAPLWHDRLAAAAFAILQEPGGGERRLRALVGTEPPPGTAGPESLVEHAKGLSRREREALVSALEVAAGPAERAPWDRMMTWDQVKDLAADGHEIGAHSMTHPILPLCEADELDWEVGESRRLIAARTGTRVVSFCYPNGSFDQTTLASVRKHGYHWAVTTEGGQNPRSAPQLALARWNMDAVEVRSLTGRLSEALLGWRISGLYPQGE